MEVRALLMTTVILLDGQDQVADAVSLSIDPNRSQFFEYESVTFYCEEVDYCDVVHKSKGKIKSCSKTNKTTPTGSSCSIKTLYADDSGEYWSETAGGKRSNSINITVTAGPVILEVPAAPVLEGETVTLRCRNKTTSSNFRADFYKDGLHISSSSTGNMTIQRISKSDEGLYKCSMSGAGESAESWLKVTDSRNVNSTTTPDVHMEESRSSSAITPWIIASVLLSALLAAVGLYHFGKGSWNRAPLYQSAKVTHSDTTEDEKVYIEPSSVTAGRAVYAVVRKKRKNEDEGGSSSGAIYCILDQDDAQQQPESGAVRDPSSAGLQQPAEDNSFYSLLQ